MTENNNWEVVIGLEVHAQLCTKSKIFSGSATTYGAQANAQASAFDIALPGRLPVANTDVIRLAVIFGLAVDAEINLTNVFARKNYFYPDLPKGYQISQMALPIVGEGHIDIVIEGVKKRVGITRAHLEEDAGKSIHDAIPGHSAIDLNRAGTPLLEIVSEPDLRSAKEAVVYLKTMHSLLRYLKVCDGNMQEGSFRCDANVSLKPYGQEELGTRSELKNINSFRFVERAINYEIERQREILESGGSVVQETRLYDPDKDQTRSMRSKEDAHDYRYFPDPDLPAVVIDEEYVQKIRDSMPELPKIRQQRFQLDFDLSEDDSSMLVADIDSANYFERAVSAEKVPAKLVANWMLGELSAYMNHDELEISQVPVKASALSTLVARIDKGIISNSAAKKVFNALWQGDTDVDAIIEDKGLGQISDQSALEQIVQEVIEANPDQAQQFKDGNQKVLGFLMGQIMQRSKGKADPQVSRQLLVKALL